MLDVPFLAYISLHRVIMLIYCLGTVPTTDSRSVVKKKRMPKNGSFYSWSFFGEVHFLQYFIQHGFICRPSDSTALEDAGIEPRTVATSALAVRQSNHSAIDLIH
jgi:hypothetical protein